MAAKYRSEAQELQKHADYLSTLENPNVKLYACINNLSYNRLHRAYHGGSNRSTRNSTNRKLTDEQYNALAAYLTHIDSIGFGVRHLQIDQAANAILRQSYSYDDSL